MTLADILKPSLTIILHAETCGIYLGAAIASSTTFPLLSLAPASINPSAEPPLVVMANLAGMGALAGAALVSAHAAVQLSRLDAHAIKARAAKLETAAGEQRDVLRALVAGGVGGVAVVSLRVVNIANVKALGVAEIVFSRGGLWEIFCFSVLGGVVGAGSSMVAKCAGEKVKVLIETMKKGEGDEDIIAAAKDVTEEASTAAAEAVTSVEEKAKDILEAVEEAKESSQ